MSNAAVYPAAKVSFLKGDLDLDGTVKIVAVSSSYTYSASHSTLADVASGARLGTAATLASKTFTNGEFNAASISYTGVAAGEVITGFVGYLSGGSAATSPLIWYCDISSDASGISYTAPGGAIAITWPYGKIFTI